jgi:hypothetical protein
MDALAMALALLDVEHPLRPIAATPTAAPPVKLKNDLLFIELLIILLLSMLEIESENAQPIVTIFTMQEICYNLSDFRKSYFIVDMREFSPSPP